MVMEPSYLNKIIKCDSPSSLWAIEIRPWQRCNDQVFVFCKQFVFFIKLIFCYDDLWEDYQDIIKLTDIDISFISLQFSPMVASSYKINQCSPIHDFLLSLIEKAPSVGLIAPALLCHKEQTQGTHSPLLSRHWVERTETKTCLWTRSQVQFSYESISEIIMF